MMRKLRILFAGTPDFAKQHLEAILETSHHVVGVYTQPDRPAGRGQKMTGSPVKSVAQQYDIPVYQPASLKSLDAQQSLQSLAPDLMVVVAYGLLLPKTVLEIPTHGCINVHASLLPRWRGAAPIQRAIEAGDPTTGVTIMQMDKGLDTGDMLLKATCPIEPQDACQTLHDRLIEVGRPALLQVINQIVNHQQHCKLQPVSGATYAHKLTKNEAVIDWSKSAETLSRKIRAFNPWPVASTMLNNSRLRVWEAYPDLSSNTRNNVSPGTIVTVDKQGVHVTTVSGNLVLTSLQFPGGRAMTIQEILNSRKDLFTIGNVFV